MSFRDLAQATTDQVFARLGEAATFESWLSGAPPTFAAPVAITILPTTEDTIVGMPDGHDIIAAETLFEIRVSELARPKVNDRITIIATGQRFRIRSDPRRRDKRGLKWLVGCGKEI